MREKKYNLEAVRAIACAGVFLYHFKEAFHPEVIKMIDYTPLRLFVLWDPMVRILLVLSGFAISYKYFSTKNYDGVLSDVVKRWYRLFPAILAANVMVYFLMRFGLLYNYQASQLLGTQNFLGAFNRFEPNFFQCVKEGLFTCYLTGASTYIAPLRMIVYEYLGVLLVLAAILTFRESKLRYLFYLAELSFFSTYYNYLVLGMMICDICVNTNIGECLAKHPVRNNVICAGAVFLLSYVPLDDNVKETRVLFALLLFAFFVTMWNSVSFGRLACKKAVKMAGELSFGIYLIHWPVIESFSSWYYIKMAQLGLSYRAIIITDFILTVIIVVSVAGYFTKYIASFGQGAVKYINEYFVKSELNE